jgi:hypothetical protein
MMTGRVYNARTTPVCTDHLRGRHCLAALRALPERVLTEALARIQTTKKCDLDGDEAAAAAASRGVLVLRGALSAAAQQLALSHWEHYYNGNATGKATRGVYGGRSIWRGGASTGTRTHGLAAAEKCHC